MIHFTGDIDSIFMRLKEIEERDIHFKRQSCLSCFEIQISFNRFPFAKLSFEDCMI